MNSLNYINSNNLLLNRPSNLYNDSTTNNSRIIGSIGERLLNSPVNNSILKLNVKSLNNHEIVTFKCKDGEVKVSSRYLKDCTDFQKRFGTICDLTFFSKKVVSEFINRLNGNSSILQETVEDYLLQFCLSSYLHKKNFESKFEIIYVDINNWISAIIFYFENREALDFIKESKPFFPHKLEKIFFPHKLEKIFFAPISIKTDAIKFNTELATRLAQILNQILSQIDSLDPQTLTILGNCLTVNRILGNCLTASHQPINFSNPLEIFQLAADKGYANAQFLLGCCYEFGIGVQMDVMKAKGLYQLAADQDHCRAKNRLTTHKTLALCDAIKLGNINNFLLTFQLCGQNGRDEPLLHGVNLLMKIRNQNPFPVSVIAIVTNRLGQKVFCNNKCIRYLEFNDFGVLLNFVPSYYEAPYTINLIAKRSPIFELITQHMSFKVEVKPPELSVNSSS